MPIGAVKFAEFELDGGRYELRRGERVLKLEKLPDGTACPPGGTQMVSSSLATKSSRRFGARTSSS